jgi:hypothetical protein
LISHNPETSPLFAKDELVELSDELEGKVDAFGWGEESCRFGTGSCGRFREG